MSEPAPEELLAGLEKRALPVRSSEEAAHLIGEMRWQCELYISDPTLKAYLERLDTSITSYMKYLEAENARLKMLVEEI